MGTPGQCHSVSSPWPTSPKGKPTAAREQAEAWRYHAEDNKVLQMLVMTVTVLQKVEFNTCANTCNSHPVPIVGLPGRKGDEGAQGPTGAKGDEGAQGPTGAKGR